MGDEFNDVGALRVEMRAMSETMQRLNGTVERLAEKLERLAILEVEHANSIGAIDRAFDEIGKIKGVLEVDRKAAEETRRGYDKWIYLAIGFCAAISLFWSVAGYRINGVIDDQIKAVAEMRQHIHDDKITSPEHVRGVPK